MALSYANLDSISRLYLVDTISKLISLANFQFGCDEFEINSRKRTYFCNFIKKISFKRLSLIK